MKSDDFFRRKHATAMIIRTGMESGVKGVIGIALHPPLFESCEGFESGASGIEESSGFGGVSGFDGISGFVESGIS